MNYGFSDYMWLIVYAWIVAFVLHQAIGGILRLMTKNKK